MTTRLKPSEFVIPKEDPFANDKLERKKCADTLTRLVQNTPGPLVISINGGWGTGKTVFLKMWNQDLQNNGFTSIYFNAWQDDYCHDSLIALIGQIWNELKNSALEEIANSVKECAAPVFRSTIFNALRTATVGIVDLNEGQLKSISEKAVDEYFTAGEKLKDLKERLGKLAQEVNKKGKPLIIIIDELDRCRPTFAIELLEKVKHLFDTPGILFVLGIDREQLGHSIRCVYGHEMNVDGYLRRFIDVEFLLPEAKLEVFVSHLFAQFGLNECFEKRKQATSKGYHHVIDDKSEFDYVFAKLCMCFRLSLRDMEHCCRLFTLAYMNTHNTHFIYPYLLAILVILKLVDNKLYRKYVSGQCTGEEVVQIILMQPRGRDFLTDRLGMVVDAHLFAASPQNWRDSLYEQMLLRFKKQTLTRPEIIPERIKAMTPEKYEELYEMYSRLLERQFFHGGEVSNHTLGYLSQKVELASLMLDYRE
ncbi:MAG: AAA family ATPase [Sedimentisphaerales bacterium]|nr:AAA family ATPase [Sedimentisphaerales bacterium]